MIDTKAVTDEIEFVQDQINACSKMVMTRAEDLCETIKGCLAEDPEEACVKIVGYVRAVESMNEATFQELLGLEGRMNALRFLLSTDKGA